MITPPTSDPIPAPADLSPTPRLLLRPEAVADALDVSRATIFALMARGELPSITIGRCRHVPLDALHDWIANRLDG